MRVLVFGSTGMVGQALQREARRRGFDVVGAARTGADRIVNLEDASSLEGVIRDVRPHCVINAAALVSLDECERNPGVAYAVNARAVALIAEACRRGECRLIQISTDHYFSGDKDRLHDETAPVVLRNEYARTKYAGEAIARCLPDALVVRTNVTGLRGLAGRPTFAEHMAQALAQRARLVLFDDYFTSTIDSDALARAVFDLSDRKASGVINVASREVAHKKRFVEALATAMGIEFDWGETGSVRNLPVPRAESCGLDVSRAEAILGSRLPDLKAVTAALASAWGARHAV